MRVSLLDSKMSILLYTCFISLNRAGKCSVNSDDDDDDGDEKHRQAQRLEIDKGILVKKF